MSGEPAVELPAEEAARRLAEDPDAVLLDVREPWEFDLARVPGAVNIPLGSLPQRVDEVPRDVGIYVMCHHGMRSMRAVAWLRGQGFDRAVNVGGGIDRWSLAVDPQVARYG